MENSLQRDYSTPFSSGKVRKRNERSVGDITNDFIEQTREDVRQEKENLKREYLDD
tara:strand:- start:1184 stop:1351 length:168 start_codon:yes stop_codon:yes gene_type:complete